MIGAVMEDSPALKAGFQAGDVLFFVNDKEVFINDRSFFQVNHGVSMKVYELIHTHLLRHSTVLDAYSGVGSIGFYIEKKAKHVTMIESNKASHLMALETKNRYQLDHIDLVLDKTEEVIDQYSADVLIVDPPRNGLMPSLLQKLETIHFKQVFYLSCDAKTLARDLQTLTKIYKIDAVYPIRMFYHTTSLETLVILSKK
jgi:23S rRNA (uracil1939-C5)-methyltransferase